MIKIKFSNREDFTRSFRLYDGLTGDTLAKSEVQDLFLELEDPNYKSPELQGSLSGGEITEQDPTLAIYTFFFPYTATRKLLQQDYDFACTIQTAATGARRQLWRTRVTVFDGIVDQT